MFNTDLTNEYRAANEMGLDTAALTQLASNGAHASLLEPASKRALLTEIETRPQ